MTISPKCEMAAEAVAKSLVINLAMQGYHSIVGRKNGSGKLHSVIPINMIEEHPDALDDVASELAKNIDQIRDGCPSRKTMESSPMAYGQYEIGRLGVFAVKNRQYFNKPYEGETVYYFFPYLTEKGLKQ